MKSMEVEGQSQGPADPLPSSPAPGRPKSFYAANIHPVVSSKVNLALLAAPLALLAKVLDWNTTLLFILALIALCPCAERLGFVTEQLAEHTNDTLGGLINATFGNITELVISIFAIQKGLLRVVQLSLLGSIVSNLLLVLGTSFILGGIYNPNKDQQSFNMQGVGVNSALLMLSAFAVLLPSTLDFSSTEAVTGKSTLSLSRAESIMLLVIYGGLLLFQLRTHRHIFDGTHDNALEPTRSGSISPEPASNPNLMAGHVNSSSGRNHADERDLWPTEPDVAVDVPSQRPSMAGSGAPMNAKPGGSRVEEDDDEDGLSFWACISWLAVLAVIISFLSDWIVGSIEVAATGLHIPMPFLTTIVLPIVGNAAEHFSAITFAIRNRMELTMGVAVGSATQIAVLIIPLTVLIGWMFNKPLDLNFFPFEAVALFGSILLTIITMQHATSNWLKGATLVGAYCFLCAGFWVHKDTYLASETA